VRGRRCATRGLRAAHARHHQRQPKLLNLTHTTDFAHHLRDNSSVSLSLWHRVNDDADPAERVKCDVRSGLGPALRSCARTFLGG